MKIISFDTETTGVSITKDRIIQLSAIVIEPSESGYKILDKKKLLLNPTIPIEQGATDVHGIADSDVELCPTFKDYSKKLFEFFNNSILHGYNIINFDIPLLMEEFNRCDLSLEVSGIIDSMRIFHDREPRNLTAALKFYAGEELIDAHDAENDVIASIKVLEGQQFMYGLSLDDSFFKSDSMDLTSKIDKDGRFTFGKAKGKLVTEDVGFANWVLRGDFPIDTKNIIRKLLNK